MMLSHAEAQALVSARFDGPLDAVAERVLNAHLATCPSCRAFNQSAGTLAQGLQRLPYLPASPTVSRAVLEHVNQPRSPWSRFSLPMGWNPIPALSAVAIALIVLFVGTFALLRLTDPTDPEPETLTAPTSQLSSTTNDVSQTNPTATSVGSSLNAPGETSPTRTSGNNAVPTSAALAGENPTSSSNNTAGPPTDEAPSSGVPTSESQPAKSGTTSEAVPTITEIPVTDSATETAVNDNQLRIANGPSQQSSPESTATVIPTDEPTVTAVPTDEPTATTVPTATSTLEPTATAIPTATATTATVIPTDEPTATAVPTETPAEPTVPPIESRDGTVIPSESGGTGTEPSTSDGQPGTVETGNGNDQGGISIRDQPTATSTDQGSNGESGDGDSNPIIVPPDGETPIPADGDATSTDVQGGNSRPDAADQTPSTNDEQGDGSDTPSSGDQSGTGGIDGEVTSQVDSGGGMSLSDAGVYGDVSSIPGDSADRLGISATGELIFSTNPGRVSLEENGLTLTPQPSESGQSVFVCDAGGSCLDATSSSATGSHSDAPLGWLNGEIIYERIDDAAAQPLSFHAISYDPGAGTFGEDRVLDQGGHDIESILRPYPVDGGLLVLARQSWLYIDANGVQARGDNPYGDGVAMIRVSPAIGEISYVAGGQLIIASVSSPGTPTTQIPFAGSDYDLSPDGSRIVINTGADLQIVDRNGQVITTIANPDGIAVGAIAWLNSGIVFVDVNNGVIRQIQYGG